MVYCLEEQDKIAFALPAVIEMNLLSDFGGIDIHGHFDLLYESPNRLTLKPELTSSVYVKQPDNTNKSKSQLIA